MKEILNEWKKYLAEQEDGSNQPPPAKRNADKYLERFLEFGKDLKPDKHRDALQTFQDLAPKDDKYDFSRRYLLTILKAAMDPKKVKPELLKNIARSLDDNMDKLELRIEDNEKGKNSYVHLVKQDNTDEIKRFDSLEVALIAMHDAAGGYVYL